MNIGLISFTKNGASTCIDIVKHLSMHECETFAKGNFDFNEIENKVIFVKSSLSEWTKEMFLHKDAIVFVSAIGIAVRSVAPYIKDKYEDPAIIVVDEMGKYAISLLSGHVGGANELAEEIANGIRALPIITTATDLNNCFSIDKWATGQGLLIKDRNLAKQVSAKLLQGNKVGFFSPYSINGDLPKGLLSKECEVNIEVSIKECTYRKNTLQLIPRTVVIGIGCRKETAQGKIEEYVSSILENENISMQAVKVVASIELKRNEQGIVGFCESHDLPFITYESAELEALEGDFTKSDFVNEITGVDNVCERAAVLGSNYGELIVKKQAKDGITIAIAIEERNYTWN